MQKTRAIIGLLAAFAVLGLLAACGGSEPTPTSTAPAPTPTDGPPTATPTALPPGVTAEPTPTSSGPSAADIFEAEWAELIVAAQAEGQLVLALGGSDSRTGRFAFEDFKRQFGIEMVTSSGSGSDNANRILAEYSRGVHTVDVVTVSGASLERLRSAEILTPVADWLIRPDVIDRSVGWYLNETIWSDRDRKYVMADSLAVGTIGSIWYNTDNVTQEDLDLIDNYTDLLRPEFKGRMAMRAMNNPGGKSVIARLWLTPGLGPEFLEAIHRDTDIDLVIPEGDKALAEGVANGKWDFGIFGGGRDFRALEALQLPVRELTLTKQVGALSTELSGGNAMLKSPPNPNAAKLFLNWWYSQEGQTADVESVSAYGPIGSVSLRSDVTQGTFPDHLWDVVQQIPGWRADGTLNERLVVFEDNDEWFEVRDATEKFFNDLYIELGYDAFVNF
ncbi:MAG: extracellular solute-binding protein [Chloroflexi bacterium]|nr:extracellular solute-binding protein [Chloroflexota bacterium]